eukprot:Nitzschia sp. Nitz4//scaffold58_size112336//30470//31967//NITZ4_004023-RA/size112336-augustus-gene-0.2-mRNA-1//1//CDS//3329554959//6542//frame0
MSRRRSKNLSHNSSFADFQDGCPAVRETEILFNSLSMIARGNNGKDIHKETKMNDVRHAVGLYVNYPLANDILAGANKREQSFKAGGAKQMNHVRGTDGWFRSMMVLEVRAFDNYILPLFVIFLNSLFAALLSEVGGVKMSSEVLVFWDQVFSTVVKSSLAFLLVFRLNRCAMRFWEARGLWGNVTHITRNLVGNILMYGKHSPRHRDMAIRWAAAFCVATMHFIRSEHDYDPAELHGFLTADQIRRMQDANHAPLYTASMVRFYLQKIFQINSRTLPATAHVYAIQMNAIEQLVTQLVQQVSGMEKIRSTPLPIAYVTHLRTILFMYCAILPYIWVRDWKWATIPLVTFTAFALFGIEGVSSEVEIPFDRSRSNHLALDAYCLVTLSSVEGLVVHDANLDLQGGEMEETADRDDDGIGVVHV